MLRERIVQTWSLLRLAPFDTSTEEGRSKERYRRVALSTAASAVAKGAAVLTTLVSVPLTVGYLGAERFGLWMTISSTIAMLGFGDLGIGLGLLNAVSEADGRRDLDAAKRYVSSGFFMLLGVASVFAVGFAAAYPFVSWARVFNVASNVAVAESGAAVAVFFACFALNIPLWVVNRIQMGYQDGFVNSLWEAFGSLLGLAGVLAAIHLRAGLPWLVLAMSGGPVVAAVFNGTVLFGAKRPWLRPRWEHVSREAAGKVFRVGILFFLAQVLGALAYSSDNIVAAQVLGPEAVTRYAIPMKMFSVVPLVLGMMLIPLWPAYGEAISRGDTGWVRRTLSRSLTVSLLAAGAATIPLVIFGPRLVHLWIGPSVAPDLLLLSGLGVWTVMSSSWGAVVMFLNGANALRLQVACTLVMGVAALGAKIFLARAVGLPGIVWGTIAAQAVFVVLPLSVHVSRLLADMGRGAAVAGHP